jgi:hypothetical protein
VESYTAFIPGIPELHSMIHWMRALSALSSALTKKLHKAKQGGCNRIVIYGQDETGATE